MIKEAIAAMLAETGLPEACFWLIALSLGVGAAVSMVILAVGKAIHGCAA